MSKTECEAFRDRSAYPARQLFKSTVLSMRLYAVAPMMRRLKELLEPKGPLTPQEAARRYNSDKFTSVLSSSDDMQPDDWNKVGCHWVRKSAGPHPNCHCGDRQGAYVLWRDADRSYCSDGLPYYYPSAIQRMRKTMEVFKPVLLIKVEGYAPIHIALARSIANPHGCVWGFATLDSWYEVRVGDATRATARKLTLTGVEKLLGELKKSREDVTVR